MRSVIHKTGASNLRFPWKQMLPVSTFEVNDGGGELLCMEQKHCQRLGEINRYQGRAGASARQLPLVPQPSFALPGENQFHHIQGLWKSVSLNSPDT